MGALRLSCLDKPFWMLVERFTMLSLITRYFVQKGHTYTQTSLLQ